MYLDYSRSVRLVECCSLSLLSSIPPKHLGPSRGKALRIPSSEPRHSCCGIFMSFKRALFKSRMAWPAEKMQKI